MRLVPPIPAAARIVRPVQTTVQLRGGRPGRNPEIHLRKEVKVSPFRGFYLSDGNTYLVCFQAVTSLAANRRAGKAGQQPAGYPANPGYTRWRRGHGLDSGKASKAGLPCGQTIATNRSRQKVSPPWWHRRAMERELTGVSTARYGSLSQEAEIPAHNRAYPGSRPGGTTRLIGGITMINNPNVVSSGGAIISL